MTLHKLFNKDNLSGLEIGKLEKRIATRAIIQNTKGDIALLYSKKHNYHEIPGGGVDADETIEQGLARECLEETGCNIEIIKELGITQEVRPLQNQFCESHGFLVKCIGDIQATNFDDDEIEADFEVVWVSLERALDLINNIRQSDNIYRTYIKDRALLFLKEAQKYS